MSNDTQIKLAGGHGASVSQQVQYGVKFPDGTTAWDVVPGTSLNIKALVVKDDPRHGNHMDGWFRVTTERADAAKIDKTLYREQHTFIQRTVILSVTDTEEL
jgi:hypothetical protein